MKKLTSIIVVLMFIFVGCSATPTKPTTAQSPEASAYTYDGDIDPVVFFSWNVVRYATCTHGHVHYFLENPDQTADIKRVETMNVPSGNGQYKLVAYRYFKNDIEHVFYLDETNAHYEQAKPEKGSRI